MKERVDATKQMLREPAAVSANGPGSQDVVSLGGGPAAGPGGPKMDAEIKTEVKEDEAGGGKKSTSSTDSRPSRKLNNGDSGGSVGVKSEDNNNKRIKLEKKHDSVKCENGKPGSVDKSSPQMPTTPQLPSSGCNTPSTIMANMPCQANLVTSSEPPFMQQQSQIFVFSTTLANQATESVCAGQCKSIIQYHMDHPNTKAFLQKHPLKPSNSLRMACPQAMTGGPNMKGQGPMSGMMHMQGHSPHGWRPGTPMDEQAMMGPGGGPMMPGGGYPPNSMGPHMMGGGWGGPGPHPHGHPMMGPGGPYMGPMMDMENPDFMGCPSGGGPMNISSSQVPDENLTSEQRQHRSKGLAQLTKIHQMLMGGNGSSQDGRGMMGPDGRPHPGMYPGGHRMTSQQQAMMFHQQGMMPPHGMMSPQQQHQHMMAQQGMAPYGPRCPGPVPPGMNGKDQFHAQREWMQIQQDFMMEKQHRMQHMRGGPGPPHMEHGPPPSYYSSISQKHAGMPGPTSPTMNGMQMPSMPPQGHMAPGMEHEAMGMYGPPHMGMDPMVPGMQGYPPHGMPPQGPMDPGFDPTMPGAMAPGISPGAPRHAGPMGPHGHHHPHMMGPGMATSPSQVTLHRAGNPEQFNPETMGGVIPPVVPTSSTNSNSSGNKPPPSYAQAQKRKRGDELDDYSKGNLQHTPSPTKIHYHLNQFEGQELTITKQLNAAFVAGSGGDESMCPTDNSVPPPSGHFNNNSHTNSPLHGPPGPNKGCHLSNPSQNNAHMSSPPVAPPSSTTGPSPMGPQTPHSAGANMRLSHFDPPPMSNGVSSAPQTPNPNPKGSLSSSSSSSSSNSVPPSSSSSAAGAAMSNITSASLANLAKGVENLSNQMQQNMMQGGPFHSIQMQGQMTAGAGGNNAVPNPTGNPANNNNSNNNSNISNNNNNNNPINAGNNNGGGGGGAAPGGGIPNAGAVSVPPSSSCQPPVSHNTNSTPSLQTATSTTTPPSVNNTYIATNMSISQVNIPNHPGLNSYVNMQMQSMTSDSSSTTTGHPQQPGAMPPGSQPHPLPPGGPAMNQAMMGGGGGGGPRGPGPGPMSHHHHHMSQSQSMMASGQVGPGMMHGPMPGQMMNHPAAGPHPSHPSHMHPNPSMTPPAISKGAQQFTSPPISHSQMPGGGGVGAPPPQVHPGVTSSPQFPSGAPQSSNSSVQIQQKGHNTIQYLPANPPSSNAMPNSNKTRPSEIDYSGMPRFPSPHPAMDVKSPASSTLQYFPNNSPGGPPRPPMSSSMSAMGPEFANQANIAMQQSAAMMRSPSLSDIQAMSGPGSAGPMPGGPPHMPPTSMGPMDGRGHHGGPMCGPNPIMPGPDPMMGMGPSGHAMRPGHSPGMMRSMQPVIGSGSLECVSPIPGMGGYMNNGPSIEQAQAQAQAHAAMMMQGNPSIPDSSPHPPGGPTNSSTPHMMPQGSNPTSSMTGTSPHGCPPMSNQQHMPSMSVPSPHGALGPSPHGQMVPGPSPHRTMAPGPSPHGHMAPGHSPHGPMGPGPSPHPHMAPGLSPHGPPMAPGPSPHGPMGGMSPHHGSMAGGGMPPHGHMPHMSGPAGMHGPHIPSMGPGGGMPRHPSMGPMGMGGPAGMGGPMGPGGSGQYPGNMQYPQYQPDFYHPSSRGPPHQMMGGPGGMMGGPPGQPYGMLPSMPGPS